MSGGTAGLEDSSFTPTAGDTFAIVLVDAAANGSTYEVIVYNNFTADSLRVADGTFNMNISDLTITDTFRTPPPATDRTDDVK